MTVDDITNLSFRSNQFDCVFAFGLYHNIESGIESALRETNRVLKANGVLVASFRNNNIQNLINDFWFRKPKKVKNRTKTFHKINYNRREILTLLRKSDFEITKMNM